MSGDDNDIVLEESLKSCGLSKGFSAPSIIKWHDNFVSKNRCSSVKFKEHLREVLAGWKEGTHKITYIGDGSIDIVPLTEDENAGNPED